ncbi:MerR family transcriptional regulator [Agreia sp.]|uniref:MerR family transcriptional regulator n=1 Tax=Agreia sp. TaxID=1872416 RepID=UPI0035BBD5F6
MRIGDLAAKTGASVRSLRYYEEQKLLAATRTAAGQREYARAAVDRVQLVQLLFAAGLPSRTIVKLLPCVDTGRAGVDELTMLVSERDRIAAQVAQLGEALGRLDAVIAISASPTPENCPALRGRSVELTPA